MSYRIAAAVVLYHCPPERLDGLQTYASQVERLYVIDNTEQPDPAVREALSRMPGVVYTANGQNQGIARALNQAARQALAEGFTHLLTMDDDSRTPPGYVRQLTDFLDQHPDLRIGILAPYHTPVRAAGEGFTHVPYTMTSGNLLSLRAYAEAGPFWEELFIDHVDHEYGLRLNRLGWAVIELTDLRLDHPLGVRKARPVLGGTFVSHSPRRGYFIARNGLAVGRRHPAFLPRALQLTAKEVLKALLWEDRRPERLRFIGRGLRDGLTGRLGPLPAV